MTHVKENSAKTEQKKVLCIHKYLFVLLLSIEMYWFLVAGNVLVYVRVELPLWKRSIHFMKYT